MMIYANQIFRWCLCNLSKIIRKYKEDEGYIDFEIEEAKIIIDDKGKTKDIVPRERSYSEIMIEDFHGKGKRDYC